jgi:hypothetical protein
LLGDEEVVQVVLHFVVAVVPGRVALRHNVLDGLDLEVSLVIHIFCDWPNPSLCIGGKPVNLFAFLMISLHGGFEM